MSEKKIIKYLQIVGWVGLIFFPLISITRLLRRLDIFSKFETPTSEFIPILVVETAASIVISLPFTVGFSILCLVAAQELKKEYTPSESVFD